MQLFQALKTGVRIIVVLTAALCLRAQEPATPSKDARPQGAQGLPARAAPSDYQAQARAGAVTIAADFVGHSVPTAQGTLSTEDFVVVEAGLYGPPEARLEISVDDFSIRINGKKTPYPGQLFGAVLHSLKDPEWSPPETEKKSKTNIGGGGDDSSSPPPVVHVPIELQRAMAQHTQEASLPLGNRALPKAGLLFFPYRGKKINSIELIYSGPAGKATLNLRP